MEKTDEKLASLIEKLQDAGFAQAPEVIDGAIRAIYFDGVFQLGFTCVFIGLFLSSIILLLYGISRDTELVQVAGIAGTVGFFLGSVLIGTINNPWLKAFDPEAFLYRQIIQGLLGA